MRSSAAVVVLLWWCGAVRVRAVTDANDSQDVTLTTDDVVTDGTVTNDTVPVTVDITTDTTQAPDSGGLSCEQVRSVVDGHNERRRRLLAGLVPGQPRATHLNTVVWDEELAEKAVRWAETRDLKHNPDRGVPSDRFVTGENMFMLSTSRSTFPPERALDAWFMEHRNYQFAPLYNRHFYRPPDTQIGHYTQMVWSRSIHVGCGLAAETRPPLTDYYFVCYYGPAGNVLGEVPYVTNGEHTDQLTCVADTCELPYGPCPAASKSSLPQPPPQSSSQLPPPAHISRYATSDDD